MGALAGFGSAEVSAGCKLLTSVSSGVWNVVLRSDKWRQDGRRAKHGKNSIAQNTKFNFFFFFFYTTLTKEQSN